MLWQIIDTQNGKLEDQYEDGLAFKPGEDGFTTDLVTKYAGSGNFNYMGTPNWHLRIEAEQKAESDAQKAKEEADAAKARIAQLLDPEGYAKAHAIALIEAEHEALAPFASKSEAAELDAVKEARLANPLSQPSPQTPPFPIAE